MMLRCASQKEYGDESDWGYEEHQAMHSPRFANRSANPSY
jgi:hypothetical protein